MFSSFPKKILLFVLIAAFVFIFSAAKKEGNKNKYVYDEMERLEDQANDLEKEKQNLSELLAILSTPGYLEKEAKKQLGLQNPGEKVIVITRKEDPIIEPAEIIESKKESNINKWLQFIFNKMDE